MGGAKRRIAPCPCNVEVLLSMARLMCVNARMCAERRDASHRQDERMCTVRDAARGWCNATEGALRRFMYAKRYEVF